MKKALTRTLLIALSIVILAGVIPLSANASTKSNKTTIFSYLTNQLGFNSAAACGIMANIEKESSFKSDVIIRDSNGLLSGGLCMWNGSRLTNLKNFCANNGFNYLSIAGQLSYLEAELQKSQYKHIYKYLKNVDNTAQGAYNAAHYWCYYFEVPANRGTKSVQRGNSAKNNYWPVYGNIKLSKPELEFKQEDTKYYYVGSSVGINWTSGGKDSDGFKLCLAARNPETGKYEYDNAKITWLSSKTCKYTFKNLKPGYYRAYVYSYSDITNQTKRSNILTFKIMCKLHDYDSEFTTVPTETDEGIKTSTCTACGKVKKTAVTLKDYIDSTKVQNVRITGITDTKIKVRWDEYKNADGYRVYVKEGDKWVRIGSTTPDDDKAFMVRNLEPGKTYTFKVKAYKDFSEERVYTVSSKTVTATTKTA